MGDSRIAGPEQHRDTASEQQTTRNRGEQSEHDAVAQCEPQPTQTGRDG